LPVNKHFLETRKRPWPLNEITCSQVIHRAISVNKLWISIHCRNEKLSYDVRSSLKELRWKAAGKTEAESLKDNPR